MHSQLRRSLCGLAAAAGLLLPILTAAQPSCPFVVEAGGTVGVGGVTHRSLQAAVNDLPNPGPCVVTVRPGTYPEAVLLADVNSLSTDEAERILIVADAPADPAADDAQKAIVEPGAGEVGFWIERSRRVTIKSFEVRGGREGVVLRGLGGDNGNEDVVLDSNDVHGNGAGSTQGAITVGQGSARTWLVNNLVRDNAGNGVLIEGSGAPGDDTVYVVNNTVLRNGYNGLRVTRKRLVYLVNNLIVANGTAAAQGSGKTLSSGVDAGRFGLFREGQGGQGVLEGTVLLHNLFYRNGTGHPSGIGGDIANITQVFEDGGDSGNYTTFGHEHGSPAIVGCTFLDCTGDTELTAIFVDPAGDLRLIAEAPAVDRGLDELEHNGADRVPRMDFEGQARPEDGNGDGTARTDIGHDEAVAALPAFRAIADCSPTTGVVPLKVRFRTRGEFAGGSIVRYRWDFQGDGIFDTTDSVPRDFFFDYLVPGVYNATLEVRNNVGDLATDVCTINVASAAPVALADADPSNGPVPLTVTFTGIGSKAGGSIDLHSWDFDGDGVFDFETSSYDHPQPETITFFLNHADCGTNDQISFFLNGSPLGTFAPKVGCTCNTAEFAFPINDPALLAAWDPAGGNTLRATIGSSVRVGYVRAVLQPGSEVCMFDRLSNGGCKLRNVCDSFQSGGTFTAAAAGNTTTTIVEHVYTTPGVFPAVFQVTDDEGRTARASAASTSVRAGVAGTPTVRASGTPTSGNAPLAVTFGGSATDDGQIVLWEWDFDGDGSYDFASPTSPAVTHTYVDAGHFVAALRATDDQGLSSVDLIEVTIGLTASLTVPIDTFDPVVGQQAAINTSISAGARVRLLLLDQGRRVVRTLFDEVRPAGNYQDFWDGRDAAGALLRQAPYYAVLEYEVGGETRSVDLTDSTGGVRYNPSRNSLPSIFRPFEDNLLTVNFTIPTARGASEILAFVGLFRIDTRFITLLERVPLGFGTHTIHWDGRAPDGSPAVAPPGDAFLFGIFGFTLPDNAIMIQSAPVVSGVKVDPNYFDPSTPSFLTPDAPVAVVTFNLNKAADVELTVTNLDTGAVMRRFFVPGVAAGNGHTIAWDGRAENGLFADKGDYRLTLRAIDSTGNSSINRFALVRVFH
jgi:PKD repeat protein